MLDIRCGHRFARGDRVRTWTVVRRVDVTDARPHAGPAGYALPTREFVACDDPVADAAALRDIAEEWPQAAIVLAHVLRAGVGLDVPAALELESFAYSTLLGGSEFRRWQSRRGRRPLSAAHPPVLLHREGNLLRLT
ncbi:hypothetical protein [Actinophytocola gossypii]|uniref:UTRA domain-containing protein n=1 Tax=Actinophytocola gossypii TaxID=2812003 RepID=A0ABT2J9P7_9PSEU|nr:hypothetical protein [Actinophytocola gossypii]MCT2584586.1 hypothetical protein [Actinophytocola gossypii]